MLTSEWGANCELPKVENFKGKTALMVFKAKNIRGKRIGNWLELIKLEGNV